MAYAVGVPSSTRTGGGWYQSGILQADLTQRYGSEPKEGRNKKTKKMKLGKQVDVGCEGEEVGGEDFFREDFRHQIA